MLQSILIRNIIGISTGIIPAAGQGLCCFTLCCCEDIPAFCCIILTAEITKQIVQRQNALAEAFYSRNIISLEQLTARFNESICIGICLALICRYILCRGNTVNKQAVKVLLRIAKSGPVTVGCAVCIIAQ